MEYIRSSQLEVMETPSYNVIIYYAQENYDCGGDENKFECGLCQCEEKDEEIIREQCTALENALMCSGAGSCRCGTCFCDNGKLFFEI